MRINLEKGQKLSSKGAIMSGLTTISMRAGWDPVPGKTMDFDIAAVTNTGVTVYYNNLNSNGIVHKGDNLTGAGDGDDEIIEIDLTQLDSSINKITLVANVYQGEAKGQSLSNLQSGFVRIVNEVEGREIVNMPIISSAFSPEDMNKTSMICSVLFKEDGKWDVKSVFEGVAGNLQQVVENL